MAYLPIVVVLVNYSSHYYAEGGPPLVYYWQGACKYYISTLGVGGGSEGNVCFAHVVRGGGGSRGKMLILLM